MIVKNSIKRFKETPENIKNLMGLFTLIIIIILTFFILNIFFGPNDKNIDIVKTSNIKEMTDADQSIISSLPRGKLIFYESDDGHKLSLKEYEVVCKNTKIVTQRAVMGANITNSEAHKLYTANGSRIDKYLVKWDSSTNKCLAGYTLKALDGTTDTVTVEGEAQGFFKTSIDTRVYFIKNF
jgi:hypothetical protein